MESCTCGFIMAGISNVVTICVLLLHAFECVDCVFVDLVDEEGASSYIGVTTCSKLTNEPLECSTWLCVGHVTVPC